MNDHDLEKFLGDAGQSAKKISMTSAEKEQRRSRLMNFMEKAAAMPAAPAEVSMEKPNLWASLVRKINPAYVAAPLLVILSAGAVYAAEGSLPGELLYGLKTNVIEKVQTSLAFSSQDKASLNAQLALKRLDEAEAVRKKNNLDPPKKLELSKDFAQKKDELMKDIQILKSENKSSEADKIYSDFSSRLHDHQQILDDIQQSENTDGTKDVRGENSTQEFSGNPSIQEQMATHEVKLRFDAKPSDGTSTEAKTTGTTIYPRTDYKTGYAVPTETKTTGIAPTLTISTAVTTQETAVR